MKRVEWAAGLAAFWLWAAPAQAEPPPEPPPAASDSQTAPSLELLEFLAEFETEDGQWMDPQELEHMELNEDPPPATEEPAHDPAH